MEEKIEVNIQFEQVLNFVNQTNQTIFLTGKAGTGKTTLLKYIKKNTFKQMAVIAPTGVAAINAGGSTIHSFFQFAFTPFLPALTLDGQPQQKQSSVALKYNSQRLAIFRNLELLVIDEVSMVRADMLDQIDVTLRQVRKKWHLPFGGVQAMLIGDMYQLPPVVQQEEWKILGQVYQSPYFFDSLVVKNNPPVYIELEKIYRQKEEKFVDLLNKVRNNNLDIDSLQELNAHYKSNITKNDYLENITLTTHNRKADQINSDNLNSLSGKAYKYKAKVDGTFSEKNYPADEILMLKKGTRVMFLKNNPEKNYYNGKIGVVSFLDDDKIKVRCEEDSYDIEVTKQEWTNVSFKVDKNTRNINEEILGTFVQYPLRLAWAITIHKSQGLTFEKLIIDAADSFSAGQVYVALSRCKSLAGLTLSSKINCETLYNDKQIVHFASSKHDNEKVNTIFSDSQRRYMVNILINTFDFSETKYLRGNLASVFQLFKNKFTGSSEMWMNTFFNQIDNLADVSTKFRNQLSLISSSTNDLEQDETLQSRLKKGAEYFFSETTKLMDDLKNCSALTESKEAADAFNADAQQIFEEIFTINYFTNTLKHGFIFSDFIEKKLKLKFPDFKINVSANANKIKVSDDVKHPGLYKKLMLLRDEICNEDQKPIYLVANNKSLIELTNFLPTNEKDLLLISGFGEAKAESFGGKFLTIIKDFMEEQHLQTAMGELKLNNGKKNKKTTSTGSASNSTIKSNTKEQTYLLYKQGLKLDEIAEKRGFTLSTVEAHLVPYIASGELNVDYLVPRYKQTIILNALKNFNKEQGITPIKSALPSEVSYTEIKYMMATLKNIV
jgi:hypothetical protein